PTALVHAGRSPDFGTRAAGDGFRYSSTRPTCCFLRAVIGGSVANNADSKALWLFRFWFHSIRFHPPVRFGGSAFHQQSRRGAYTGVRIGIVAPAATLLPGFRRSIRATNPKLT